MNNTGKTECLYCLGWVMPTSPLVLGHYTPQSKCEAAAGAQPFSKFVTVMHSYDSYDSI